MCFISFAVIYMYAYFKTHFIKIELLITNLTRIHVTKISTFEKFEKAEGYEDWHSYMLYS